MSDEVYSDGGLLVVRLISPASDPPDRTRWEISVEGDAEISQTRLDRDQIRALTEALARSIYARASP